jgi:hypothetical protein
MSIVVKAYRFIEITNLYMESAQLIVDIYAIGMEEVGVASVACKRPKPRSRSKKLGPQISARALSACIDHVIL